MKLLVSSCLKVELYFDVFSVCGFSSAIHIGCAFERSISLAEESFAAQPISRRIGRGVGRDGVEDVVGFDAFFAGFTCLVEGEAEDGGMQGDHGLDEVGFVG